MAFDDSFAVEHPKLIGPWEAQKWENRRLRRRNIYDRLKAVGKLSLLGLTSILTGLELDDIEGWVVKPLVEETNWKVVFRTSYMYRTNAVNVNRAVAALTTSSYKRAEEAFRSFSANLCISVEDEGDLKLVQNVNELKRWCYRSMTTDAGVDRVCSYLKWLTKSCQAIFLEGYALERESWFPSINGKNHPYEGTKLAFVGQLLDGMRISLSSLEREQVESLVQLANGVRALPYPSLAQSQEAIDKVVDILSKKPRVEETHVGLYKASLALVGARIGSSEPCDTHVSLTTSACLEETQADGGKGAALISALKELLDRVPEKEALAGLEDLRDHIGAVVFHRGISAFAGPNVKLYNLAYLKPDKAEEYLDGMREGEPPYDFGMCLMLTASWLLGGPAGLGQFDDRIPNRYDIPLFLGRTKLRLTSGPVPTRASVVLERGLKTRLVTSMPAAKALVEQAMGHIVRAYLSRDKFLRIGFEESDKLWEVLKEYHKRWATTHPQTR